MADRRSWWPQVPAFNREMKIEQNIKWKGSSLKDGDHSEYGQKCTSHCLPFLIEASVSRSKIRDKQQTDIQLNKTLKASWMGDLLVCLCTWGWVCVQTPQSTENSFACPFTELPFAAQCSCWTKRPHCEIQMKGEEGAGRLRGLLVEYGGWVM